MDLDEVVALSVKHNAADLHLCSGHLPHWRRQGGLEPIPQQTALDGDWLETFLQQWLSGVQHDELEASGHVDFAIT